MIQDKIDALRKCEMFRVLDDAEALRALAARSVERQLTANEVLFVAGEEANGLYVIVKGALRAVRMSPDGREQIVHIERAGATIAEVPVFDDKPFPSTVIAEQDSHVLFIAKADVRKLCLEHPPIALAALRLLAARLRRCAELVEVLSLKEVGQRLARFLLREAKQTGEVSEGETVVVLSLNNQQIAARIGTVREVVSRAFTRLQHDGLISLNHRRVTIKDARKLTAYAGIDYQN